MLKTIYLPWWGYFCNGQKYSWTHYHSKDTIGSSHYNYQYDMTWSKLLQQIMQSINQSQMYCNRMLTDCTQGPRIILDQPSFSPGATRSLQRMLSSNFGPLHSSWSLDCKENYWQFTGCFIHGGPCLGSLHWTIIIMHDDCLSTFTIWCIQENHPVIFEEFMIGNDNKSNLFSCLAGQVASLKKDGEDVVTTHNEDVMCPTEINHQMLTPCHYDEADTRFYSTQLQYWLQGIVYVMGEWWLNQCLSWMWETGTICTC